MSGRLHFDIILWAKFGSGIDCICDIKVEAKPPKSTLAALEARAKKMAAQAVQLALHEVATFEIHGICSLKLGKGGFAIDGVRVCRSVGVRHTDKLNLQDCMKHPYFSAQVFVVFIMYFFFCHVRLACFVGSGEGGF